MDQKIGFDQQAEVRWGGLRRDTAPVRELPEAPLPQTAVEVFNYLTFGSVIAEVRRMRVLVVILAISLTNCAAHRPLLNAGIPTPRSVPMPTGDFIPNVIYYPVGADLTALGKPVPPESRGPAYPFPKGGLWVAVWPIPTSGEACRFPSIKITAALEIRRN
jgi:hypothetical protein